MATSSTIHLTPTQQPAYYVRGISSETADKANELLQENHEKHHIFFNEDGFHNHIAHHLLTLFALNASPSELKTAYDSNTSYQRPSVPVKKAVVQDMHTPEKFKSYLGHEKYYPDFLVFFEDEINKNGWEEVLKEYVFKGDERADDMLVRMFAGFLHPIIHLGFGVEFLQPAIIAEALAQAAVHDRWIGALFHESEKAAQSHSNQPSKSIVQLLDEIHADKKLAAGAATQFDDPNKIRDGILKRAKEEMISYTAQYRVNETDLEERTAEMINAAVYFTATSQHPPHIPKVDFFYMHSVNASIFFTTFLRLPFLPAATKVRLLEWKVRIDLAMYVSRGSPALLLHEVESYKGKQDSDWNGIFARVRRYDDDGHASKLIRALAHGDQVCKAWEGKEGFRIRGEVWRRLGNMVIDSVEARGPTWIRGAGFEVAWEDVPIRDGESRL